jgi:hypothetical protein
MRPWFFVTISFIVAGFGLWLIDGWWPWFIAGMTISSFVSYQKLKPHLQKRQPGKLVDTSSQLQIAECFNVLVVTVVFGAVIGSGFWLLDLLLTAAATNLIF